jgi:5-methylcytosine-specific restriction endonuclease McrA
MPTKKKRNYRVEYDRYHSKPKQRKNRSMRNKARRKLKLKVGDKREVDHKRPLSKGGTNARTNIRIVRRKSNRKKYNK